MSSEKKIGLITTLNTNIGDDFIREGIILLLEEILGKENLDIVKINKHKPFTIYKKYNPVRIVERLPRGKFKARKWLDRFSTNYGSTLFDDRELLIQCGTPVIWPGCSNAEWVVPIWHNAINRNKDKAVCINLAAGSAYPYENQNQQTLNRSDKDYVKSIIDYCKLTTVRDKLAQNLYKEAGYEAELLPCTGFFAGINYSKADQSNKSILINYMEGGGHYDWRQNIDPNHWRQIIQTFIKKNKKKYDIILLAHNKNEYELANKLDPDLKRIWPKTIQEYFTAVKHARMAISNRMHASVAMGGLGIPSIAVCTDTRLKMVDELGLPTFYVKNTSLENLEANFWRLYDNFETERGKLLKLQEISFNKYIGILTKILK